MARQYTARASLTLTPARIVDLRKPRGDVHGKTRLPVTARAHYAAYLRPRLVMAVRPVRGDLRCWVEDTLRQQLAVIGELALRPSAGRRRGRGVAILADVASVLCLDGATLGATQRKAHRQRQPKQVVSKAV